MGKALELGVAAAKAGRKNEALNYLKQAVNENPREVEAWLWIYNLVDDRRTQRYCLEQVLKVEPHNFFAVQGMNFLNSVSPVSPVQSQKATVQPAPTPPLNNSSSKNPNPAPTKQPQTSKSKRKGSSWGIILGLIFVCVLCGVTGVFAFSYVTNGNFSTADLQSFLEKLLSDPEGNQLLAQLFATFAGGIQMLCLLPVLIWAAYGYIGAFLLSKKGYTLELVGCIILAGGLPILVPAFLGPLLYWWGKSVQPKN